MTIVITDADDPLYLTAAEHAQWQHRYSKAFEYFYGSPPPFESWVRNQMNAFKKEDAR